MVGRHRRTKPRQGQQSDMPPPFRSSGGVRRPRPTSATASFRPSDAGSERARAQVGARASSLTYAGQERPWVIKVLSYFAKKLTKPASRQEGMV